MSARDTLVLDALALRRWVRIVVHGGSMRGAIADGSLVEVRELDGPPALGDVLCARHGGTFLVHRVVGIDARGRVLLRGDACPSPDGWIEPQDVVGRVSLVDARGAVCDVPSPRPLTPRPLWRRALSRFARAAGVAHAI